jgi:ATP-dependent Clp protease ATP-binding subunit ClpB
VFVNEPSVEDTVSILRGLKDKYEQHPRRPHHRRRDRVGGDLVAPLHRRPLSARTRPSIWSTRPRRGLKMQVDSKPDELDSIDREIVRLKIEQEALKKESDPRLKGAAEEARRRAHSLEKQSADLTARWKSEKDKLSNAQKLKTELDALRVELANAQRRGEYQRPASWLTAAFPSLRRS